MDPSTTSVRAAMALLLCLGSIEIVEAIVLASIPSSGYGSCLSALMVLLMFLKTTGACFSCFTAIASFFTLSAVFLVPMEVFVVWNTASTLISLPVNVIAYWVRLAESRLRVSEYGCIGEYGEPQPEFFAARIGFAVFLGVVQLLIIREANDYYEQLLSSEDNTDQLTLEPSARSPDPEVVAAPRPVDPEKKVAQAKPDAREREAHRRE